MTPYEAAAQLSDVPSSPVREEGGRKGGREGGEREGERERGREGASKEETEKEK